MYLFFILFFISLLAMTIMVVRKLKVLHKLNFGITEGEFLINVLELEDLKHSAVRSVKKHGYKALVSTLRIYVRSLHLIKSKLHKLEAKINEMKTKKRIANGLPEQIEANKFLRMISDYKRKIKRIKKEIREEEGLE